MKLRKHLVPLTVCLVSGFAAASNAVAADLGGDCCADIEERVAELEATTARKGNRKVNLTVTGWVSSQIYFWDDGEESNAYVVDNSTDLASNFKFMGSAKIAPGWDAGFMISVFTDTGNSLASDQANDEGGAALTVEHSYWWIGNDKLGKVSVGKQFGAADNTVVFTDFTGTLFPANTVVFDGAFMRLRPSDGTGLAASPFGTWQGFLWCEPVGIGIGGDCNGLRTNTVKYESPAFGGFSLAASWGEDDQTDLFVNYNGEHGGFKISAAASYAWNTDNAGVGLGPIFDSEYFQAGGTIKHMASNLWLHGGYARQDVDEVGMPDGHHFYLKAGWSPKLNALGSTHFYGEWARYTDEFGALARPGATCAAFFGAGGAISNACANAADPTITITDSEVDRWGLGVVQEIDAASMTLWAKWRMMELDATFTGGGQQEFEDLQMVLTGAVIFF